MKLARPFALTSIALLSAGVLAGCGSDDEDKKSDDASASTSASAEQTSEASSSATETASSEASSSSSSASSDAQSRSASDPAGTHRVTAKTNKVSFNVPDSYVDIQDPANQDKLEEWAADDPENQERVDLIRSQQATFDAAYIAFGDDLPNTGSSISVAALPVTEDGVLPTEEEFRQTIIDSTGADITDVDDVETSMGEGVRATFTTDQSGKMMYGEMLCVLNADGEGVFVSFIAPTEDEADDIADLFLDTVQPA